MSLRQKKINLLTICIKAGKTVRGYDSVCEEMKSGRVSCVMTAADISAKSLKETKFMCSRYGVNHIETELTKEEIGHISGKQTAVIAVCDEGFAKRFAELSECVSDNT
jgi:ribosomal protein L7Ae-like RNA K-turn-binding protein